jgi:hypothetical protein
MRHPPLLDPLIVLFSAVRFPDETGFVYFPDKLTRPIVSVLRTDVAGRGLRFGVAERAPFFLYSRRKSLPQAT